MPKNFSTRIQVRSSDEPTSLMFAFRLVPLIGRLLEREPRTAVIVPDWMPRLYGGEISAALGGQAVRFQFHDCDTFSFDTACDRLDSLARAGVNTIILSQEYLRWDTSHETINQGIDDLNECMDRHQMTLALIESAAQCGDEFKRCFSRVPECERLSLEQVIERMLNDYRRTSMLMPFGALPHFILDPATDVFGTPGREVRVIAGYEKWEYNVNVGG